MTREKKSKKPQPFQIELLPWKSKKCPKDVPTPLPRVGSISWVLCGRSESGKTLHMINIIRSYRKQMHVIYVLSPSLHLDPKWEAIKNYDNVIGGDEVNNEVIAKIVEVQKENYDPKNPNEFRCLLVVDDAGVDIRRANLRYAMNTLFSRFRHLGGNLMVGVQSLTQLEGSMITNSKQWTLWDMNQRQLKKLSNDIATATMPEKELEAFIREGTKKPYSFVFIDYTAEHGKKFRWGFGDPYIPEKLREDFHKNNFRNEG